MIENNEDDYAVQLVYGHYKHIHIASFVKDLVLDGPERVVETCNRHNVSDTDFQEIIELPVFKKEMREIRALVEASPNSLIQLKARHIVEQGLECMKDIIMNGEKNSDRIKAMEFVSKIAGAFDVGRLNSNSESDAKQASGLVLNVNLGNGGLIPPLPDQPRPLRKISEVMEVIDIAPDK